MDFNICNLQCELCWSNNHDIAKLFSPEGISDNFSACAKTNHQYIYEIKKPAKADTFKLQSLQIVGGEPLLNAERFKFIVETISKMDLLFVNNFEFYDSSVKTDKQNRFELKLFTNGITIGDGTIDLLEIEKLNQFKHIKINLLVSVKGLNEEGFLSLQHEDFKQISYFEYQIACLEKLLTLAGDNVKVQPVLGFYHSQLFNIKAPNIDAGKMFAFEETPLSRRLHHVLEAYITKKHGFYVEPVHALGKSKEALQKFYMDHEAFLERENLLEPKLVSNHKTDYRKTNLADVFFEK